MNETPFPTPTTHGDWHIIDGELVDLSQAKPDPKASRNRKADATEAAANDTSKEQ